MNIETIINQLTLEEKAALLQGKTVWTTRDVSRLGIPSIYLSDGPHGLRKQAGAADILGLNESIPATCFPTAATMANSWDPELGEALGNALGQEAAANDVHVLLGPGLNMKRSPLCGRNFEYFSEDPYLAGKMAAAYIRGIQSQGVAACPKHFAANSQELRRMSTDSVVDERTLREIYLTGFEIAVTEGNPKAIMSSYNRVNGTYANENSCLLQDILRKEWGFRGFVMSDWGGSNDHTEGVRNGSALEMPSPGCSSALGLIRAVREGRLEESTLDDRLRELLPIVLETHEAVKNAPKTLDPEALHALAQRCAGQSIVLLENDGILPLKPGSRVAVVGQFADTPRYQGAGSSKVNPTKVDRLVDSLKGKGLHLTGFAPGYPRSDEEDALALMDDAVRLAMGAEVVLLCIGLDDDSEVEGMDRSHMRLPEDQLALLQALRRVNSNIVLVLSGGSPFEMPPQSCYRAAIHGYLAGQAGAGAMADALTGTINPSGKLSESWPVRLEDTPCYRYFPGRQRTCEYREGLYIGYRYYDTAGIPVRYPFGHGLSYTQFAYGNLKIDNRSVSFTVTNTGSRAGAEVAQIYVSCIDGKVFRPIKELKGFRKVYLEPGQSKTVTVHLDDKAFRYFNVQTRRFESEAGEYEILVAASSADIRLRGCLQIAGTFEGTPYGSLPSYQSGQVADVSGEEFTALLGRPLPDPRWSEKMDTNDPLCRLEFSKSILGRLIHRILAKKIAEKGADPELLFIYNMPIRALAKNAGGLITADMAEDFLFLANGHGILGPIRLLWHFFAGKRQHKAFEKKLSQLPEVAEIQ